MNASSSIAKQNVHLIYRSFNEINSAFIIIIITIFIQLLTFKDVTEMDEPSTFIATLAAVPAGEQRWRESSLFPPIR